MAKFEIEIQNEATLSFVELREIVGIIDDHIARAKWSPRKSRRRFTFPPFFFDDEWFGYEPDFSFVEIERVRPGSIIIDVAIGGAVVWAITALALGMRRSRLGNELSRFGENAGNILSDGLDVVNDRLEDWSEANQRLRDRKTKARVKRLPPEQT